MTKREISILWLCDEEAAQIYIDALALMDDIRDGKKVRMGYILS